MSKNDNTPGFELKVTVDGVPVALNVTYPEGKGMAGVRALYLAGDSYAKQILAQLAAQGDPSVITTLANAGLDFDHTDDDLDDEDY